MHEAKNAQHDPQGHVTGHEERDVNLRPIVIAGAGFFVLTAVIFVLMWVLFNYYRGREAERSPAANPLAGRLSRQEPPAPRLQPDPEKDLAALHSEENALLQNYGWVDKKDGIVRIPIERAIDLLAERGLPAATGAAPEPRKAAAPAAPAQNAAPEPKQEGQSS